MNYECYKSKKFDYMLYVCWYCKIFMKIYKKNYLKWLNLDNWGYKILFI